VFVFLDEDCRPFLMSFENSRNDYINAVIILLFKVWNIAKNIMYMHIILTSWSYLLFQFDLAEYSSYLTNTMNAISLCLTYQLVYVIYQIGNTDYIW
jgi:hypothetical protein